MAVELEVEPPRVEQVLDPQEDFEPVERLGQEVFRAGGQGALPGLERHVRGQHEHREIDVLGNGERLDDGHPVEVRHHEIEQDEIRLEGLVERRRLP